MSGHIADKAGFLAALSSEDPERKLAEEHARRCPPCREALDEGHLLVALLARALPLAPPAPELVGRAARAIEDERAAERAAELRTAHLLRWAAPAAVVLAWTLQVAYGKRIDGDAGHVTLSLALLAAAVVGVMAARAGPRAGQRLVLAAMVLASGLFAYLIGAVSAVAPRFGVECTVCELVAAAIPWLVVTTLARRRQIPIERGTAMAVAVAGALASQAAQLLTCPVSRANPHLLVFHFGGVLLAMALGALNGAGAVAAAGIRS
jgi:hypothetical protein